MPNRLRPAVRLALPVLAVLAVGLGIVLVLHAYEDWQSLRRPATVRMQDTSPIRGWMTVRFIANAHRVPVPALAARLDAPPDGQITLDELARERGVPPALEQEQARQAVAELVRAQPSSSSGAVWA